MDREFKVRFVRVYRWVLRRKLKVEIRNRLELETTVFEKAVDHQISTKTATELIQAQSPRFAAALIARPAIKHLSESQVAELLHSCDLWLAHLQSTPEARLSVRELEKVLLPKYNERPKTTKSPRNRRVVKQRSLKCG